MLTDFVPQAILFRDGKAIGRLVVPEQRTELLGSSFATAQHVPTAPVGGGGGGAQSAAAGTARKSPSELSQELSRPECSAGDSPQLAGAISPQVQPLQIVHLSFGHWRPASRGKAADRPGSLNIPVDAAFRSAEFRIQVGAFTLYGWRVEGFTAT